MDSQCWLFFFFSFFIFLGGGKKVSSAFIYLMAITAQTAMDALLASVANKMSVISFSMYFFRILVCTSDSLMFTNNLELFLALIGLLLGH